MTQEQTSPTEVAPHIVGVQFSGKPAVYSYLIHPLDEVQVGWRVVVPTTLKDDDTVSLSIATVVSRSHVLPEGEFKPVVTSIFPALIAHAKSELLRIAALEAKA